MSSKRPPFSLVFPARATRLPHSSAESTARLCIVASSYQIDSPNTAIILLNKYIHHDKETGRFANYHCYSSVLTSIRSHHTSAQRAETGSSWLAGWLHWYMVHWYTKVRHNTPYLPYHLFPGLIWFLIAGI